MAGLAAAASRSLSDICDRDPGCVEPDLPLAVSSASLPSRSWPGLRPVETAQSPWHRQHSSWLYRAVPGHVRREPQRAQKRGVPAATGTAEREPCGSATSSGNPAIRSLPESATVEAG